MKIIAWLVGVPVGLLVLMFIIGSMAGPPTPQENARESIKQCWADQGRKSHSAGQSQFVAGVCEMMEKQYRAEYGSSP